MNRLKLDYLFNAVFYPEVSYSEQNVMQLGEKTEKKKTERFLNDLRVSKFNFDQ